MGLVIYYFEQHDEGIYSTINVISSWSMSGQNLELSKQRHVVACRKVYKMESHNSTMYVLLPDYIQRLRG